MFTEPKQVCGFMLRCLIGGKNGIIFDSSADPTHAIQVKACQNNRVLIVRTHIVHPFMGCLEVVSPFAVYNDEEGPQFIAGVMLAWLCKGGNEITLDHVAEMEDYLREQLAAHAAKLEG